MGTSAGVTRFVTTVMGIVIGLTFLFGFGNVLALALRIGVPVYVAPLVAPAVDLTVLGLLVGTRYLAMHGASDLQLLPARRLLLAASVVTLALNVAEPVCTGQWGKAAFDAVGPLLLIGWAEVGPGLLRGLQVAGARADVPTECGREMAAAGNEQGMPVQHHVDSPRQTTPEPRLVAIGNELERARALNAAHWTRHKRPISADTLRRELRIGATKARRLCAVLRKELAEACDLALVLDTKPLADMAQM
ncbi:hypothetical protein H5970_05080 [Amycolatopsis sp. CM201R]|nr:hypothetical protein [Amycolatopsis sp. 505]MDS0141755.1 hypothetical protein [Amycolatopsis sp. CM201R]